MSEDRKPENSLEDRLSVSSRASSTAALSEESEESSIAEDNDVWPGLE